MGGLGVPEIFLVALVLGLLVLPLWAAFDAYSRPAHHWQRIGQNQTVWVIVLPGGFFRSPRAARGDRLLHGGSTEARPRRPARRIRGMTGNERDGQERDERSARRLVRKRRSGSVLAIARARR